MRYGHPYFNKVKVDSLNPNTILVAQKRTKFMDTYCRLHKLFFTSKMMQIT